MYSTITETRGWSSEYSMTTCVVSSNAWRSSSSGIPREEIREKMLSPSDLLRSMHTVFVMGNTLAEASGSSTLISYVLSDQSILSAMS